MPEMKLIGFAGFQEEGEDVYLYQCPKCKAVSYNINTLTECGCDKQQLNPSVVIVTKTNWNSYLKGHAKSLSTIQESQLHHLFGDYPEEHIVRLRIEEVK